MKIVMKFGGTSVMSDQHIRQVSRLIANYFAEGHKIVVVISALKGVTDDLIEVSEEARSGNQNQVNEFIQKMIKKHMAIARRTMENEVILEEVEQKIRKAIDELERALTGIIYLGELTPRSKDYILSFGERLSTPIVWGALRELELNAQYFTGKNLGIVTNSNFGEARPLINVTKHQVSERMEPLIEKRIIPVVTGYMATTQEGVITTLGRGGSDYTATIIGTSLSAEEVWIWTDVDGLMTADPKIVPTAKTIPEISFKEAVEMAVFGAKAMHPRALEPAMEENIPIRIRNTFNPKNLGTLIVKEQKVNHQKIVKAVTLIKDVALVNVSGAGMIGTPGSAARVFNILGRNNINILMISQSASEVNISFIIQRSSLEKAVNTLEIAFLGRGLIREVTAEDDICVVAVVGAGMRGTPGVSARVFRAISHKGINIRMIAQGSSELNISLVVKENEGEEAVRAIHEEFKLDKTNY